MTAYDPTQTPVVAAEHVETWHDESRRRDVPVRLRLPDEAFASSRRMPLVVFSHGLGGSRDGYAYLGAHLARRGWLVAHPQHAGSDTIAFRETGGAPEEALVRFTSDPENLRNRPLDVTFVIDELLRHPEFGDRVDRERIAVCGHSFGAYTALAAVGQRVELPGQSGASFRDERLRAAVAMSPSGAGALGAAPGAWEEIETPCLLITGTRDDPPGRRPLRWRWEPFKEITRADAIMALIDGAHHFSFTDVSGLRIAARSTADPKHHRWISALVAAFLDAYVRSDRAALEWLHGGGPASLSGGGCQVEWNRSGQGTGAGSAAR